VESMTVPEPVTVPDIGDHEAVEVIEVLVVPGDAIAKDATVIVLESDKATMDIPAPRSGVVAEVHVRVGDRVSKGSPVLSLRGAAEGRAVKPSPPPASAPEPALGQVSAAVVPATETERVAVRASPSLRKLGRELRLDLAQITPTGPAGRLRREDIDAFVRERDAPAAEPGVDVGRFGPVERKPLSRVQRISGAHVTRSWTTIPHVTNFDEADVTDLETFRVTVNREQERRGIKVTMLAFLLKASAEALRQHAEFNTSLDGDDLVYRRYVHIGFAADTPSGLLVPVVRDVDRKGVLQIAQEVAELAARARQGKLPASEMQGGCFSISSLGGVGGLGFTPIINAPEVAILGAARARQQPVWNGSAFVPRLMLPLALSWDHRVLDGVAAARFLVTLAALLADLRRVLL